MLASTPAPETLLRAVRSLPSAPQILAKVSHLLADPNSDLEQMTALIKRDAAMTASIVRISNSAMYGQSEPCGSLEEAVARVGFAELYRLVGFATTAQLAPQMLALYGVSGAQFRENALLTALVMEQLAPLAHVDAPTAYTAGLLRSIGKIALDRHVPASAGISFESHGSGPLLEWENAVAGLCNAQAAEIILNEWRFPAETIETVRHHYRPETSQPLASLLNLAAGAAERCGHGWPGEHFYWEQTAIRLSAAGLEESQLDDAMRAALELFGPVRAAVG